VVMDDRSDKEKQSKYVQKSATKCFETKEREETKVLYKTDETKEQRRCEQLKRSCWTLADRFVLVTSPTVPADRFRSSPKHSAV
jgi:hypothetical protein